MGKLRLKLPGALTDNTENLLIPGQRTTARFPPKPELGVIPKAEMVKNSRSGASAGSSEAESEGVTTLYIHNSGHCWQGQQLLETRVWM